MATSSVTWWLIFGHLQQWKFAKVGTKFCQLLNPNKKRHKLKNKPNWQKLANLVTLKARGCNLLLDLDVLFEPPRSCDNLSRYKITSSLKSFIKIYLAKSISWVKKNFLVLVPERPQRRDDPAVQWPPSSASRHRCRQTEAKKSRSYTCLILASNYKCIFSVDIFYCISAAICSRS